MPITIAGTVADWQTYAAARGQTVNNSTNEISALQRAKDYIRTRYVIRFLDEYDGSEPEVEEAVYIAAGLEMDNPGFWSQTFTPSQAKVLTKVEGIQWTPIQSAGLGGAADMQPVSPMIDALLLPLTRWGLPAVTVG
jgi:hypothetical protein